MFKVFYAYLIFFYEIPERVKRSPLSLLVDTLHIVLRVKKALGSACERYLKINNLKINKFSTNVQFCNQVSSP